jgi:Cu+-exporting ATPase
MKQIVISIVVAVVIIAVPLVLFRGSKKEVPLQENINNVSIVDGKQIIDMTAKGGYSPRHSIAKAGISTVLRVSTSGTFDCSASIRLPSINVSKILPQTGTTEIDLGTQKVGLFKGTCGMGMYPFDIDFQ